MISTIRAGPVEQLQAHASAPRLCRVISAVTGSLPVRVRPFHSRSHRNADRQVAAFPYGQQGGPGLLNVQHGFMTKRSTPPSRRPRACSL